MAWVITRVSDKVFNDASSVECPVEPLMKFVDARLNVFVIQSSHFVGSGTDEMKLLQCRSDLEKSNLMLKFEFSLPNLPPNLRYIKVEQPQPLGTGPSEGDSVTRFYRYSKDVAVDSEDVGWWIRSVDLTVDESGTVEWWMEDIRPSSLGRAGIEWRSKNIDLVSTIEDLPPGFMPPRHAWYRFAGPSSSGTTWTFEGGWITEGVLTRNNCIIVAVPLKYEGVKLIPGLPFRFALEDSNSNALTQKWLVYETACVTALTACTFEGFSFTTSVCEDQSQTELCGVKGYNFLADEYWVVSLGRCTLFEDHFAHGYFGGFRNRFVLVSKSVQNFEYGCFPIKQDSCSKLLEQEVSLTVKEFELPVTVEDPYSIVPDPGSVAVQDWCEERAIIGYVTHDFYVQSI